WSLEDADRNGRITIEVGIRRIILRREFNRCDVFHSYDGVRRLLDDDVAEFLSACQSAKRLYGNLERARLVHWRLVEHARCNLHVLTLQGEDDVIGGETEWLQSVRVEPGAPRVIAAAEYDERGNAVDARNRFCGFDGCV